MMTPSLWSFLGDLALVNHGAAVSITRMLRDGECTDMGAASLETTVSPTGESARVRKAAAPCEQLRLGG
jgi:hypothetical protein